MTAGEFNKLLPEGKVNPHRVRTLQDSINNKFRPKEGEKSGKSVLETTNELRTIPNKEDDIDEIRIFEMDGKVFALDHRRLVSHRLADVQIRYRKATRREVRKELKGKRSTMDDGMTIEIRQHNQDATW